MQHEVKQRTLLLDEKGCLTEAGYAARMNFVYNREKVKSFPLKLKEWNFYQIAKEHYVLQLTIGHVSYMCSVSAILINLDTGEKYEIGEMKPFFIPHLDRDPEGESVNSFQGKQLDMSFQVTSGKRILSVKGCSRQFQHVEIQIELDNDAENQKMVIATPFQKAGQFYLNYKENYYSGMGKVCFDDLQVDFDGCTGLIDWGRGVWPYSHEWFWGNLTSHIDGVPFGFNIGWGFGNLDAATENMYFYDRKAYKVGRLLTERDEKDDQKPWKLRDEEGRLRMTFQPIYDNYTENKYLVIDTHCHQLYGYFDGEVETDAGRKEFHGMLAFIEHAVNRW